MRPSLSSFDTADGVITHAIFGGNDLLLTCVSKYGDYLRLGQLGGGALLSLIRCAMFNSIQLIGGRRIPAQISKEVIGCVAVVMAALVTERIWANESDQNKPMYLRAFLFPVAPNHYPHPVVLFALVLAFYGSCLRVFNTPVVRNFVKTFIANNGLPCLDHLALHAVSGYVGFYHRDAK